MPRISPPCDACHAFHETTRITSPAALSAAIRRARDALRRGALRLHAFRDATAYAPVCEPFDELPDAGPWPDVLSYGFACPRCGRTFRLQAETYHGAGGSLGPHEDDGP